MKLTALALTAGLGTRLRPYTFEMAKPAIPFMGVPLLKHALRHLEKLPIEKLVLNLHHLPDSIRNLQINDLRLPVPDFSDETSEILGSGGAVAKIFPHVETDQILLLNGDEVYLPEQNEALLLAYHEHVRSGRLATLVTMSHPEVGKSLGGAWCDRDGNVIRFAKTAQADLIGHHYVGYLFLRRSIGKYFRTDVREQNILYDNLSAAIAMGERVCCYHTPAHWYETGNPKSFLEATKDLLAQVVSESPVEPSLRDYVSFIRAHRPYELLIEKEIPSLAKELGIWLKM